MKKKKKRRVKNKIAVASIFYFILQTSIKIILEVLARAIRQEKEQDDGLKLNHSNK